MKRVYDDLIKNNLYRMNPNVKTRGGYTPLMLSAMHRRQSVFNLLLNTYGANPNIRFPRVCQVKIIHFQSYLRKRNILESISKYPFKLLLRYNLFFIQSKEMKSWVRLRGPVIQANGRMT